MSLRTGDTLGAYEILESIGKGGMGEVFRARDPRMGRDVAIKISVESFPARFSREVHAIAALNHPNVCTLHDVGPDYLVMELVEGPTLAERIAEGAIPLEEALAIARQIADALEAAHEQGIVHRDLKPGNVKLKPNGSVKVLDFGLAKLGGTPTASNDFSPTLSMHATQAGVILGTAAYMAPEQARGKTVDRRADIWAFGVVLCEMVTGRRLFQGEDLTETLASVVKVEPDLSDAPPRLRRLLKKCLEKDPRKRLRDIGDVWELLDADASTATVAAAPVGRASLIPWIAVGLLVLGMSALAFVHFREGPPEVRAVVFTLDPPPGTTFVNLYGAYATSPDGQYIVFSATPRGAGSTSLWLRSLNSLTARPLPGTEGGNFPTWSPDNRSIAFAVDGKLKRIEIAGGAPLTLGDAPNDTVSPTGTWNRDGVILFGSATGLWRVSASQGGPTRLTETVAGETGHGYPQFLPDGRRFLYFVDSADPNVQGVYASSLDNPKQRAQVLRTAAKAVYVSPRAPHPGYLLWMQEDTLMAQPFDADSLQRDGDPVSIAEEVGLNPGAPIRVSFWASESGLLIYFAVPGGLNRPIVWMSRDGKPLGEAVPEDSHSMPALSPDAGRLAFMRMVSEGGSRANLDVWLWEFARRTTMRLTFDASEDSVPVWSPDGKQVAFASRRENNVSQIYRKDASGAGKDERLTEGPAPNIPLDWSRDGRYLLYRERGPDTSWDLMALPLEGNRTPIALVRTRFTEDVGRFSPDGLWLAYKANDTGRNEIYIQAFARTGVTTPSGRWQISNGGASDMKWRDDGRELYYETTDGRVMAVGIQAGPEGVRPETPRELFSADIDFSVLHSFDATGDGKRFLLLLRARSEGSTPRLTVVSNWQAALRK